MKKQLFLGPIQNEAVTSVLYPWALPDPVGAAAWPELFPENPLRDRAANELAGIATSYDRPREASVTDSRLP